MFCSISRFDSSYLRFIFSFGIDYYRTTDEFFNYFNCYAYLKENLCDSSSYISLREDELLIGGLYETCVVFKSIEFYRNINASGKIYKFEEN